jgi:hypothetical protein
MVKALFHHVIPASLYGGPTAYPVCPALTASSSNVNEPMLPPPFLTKPSRIYAPVSARVFPLR